MKNRETKTCYICKSEKPAAAFSKNRSKYDGLPSQCKDCDSAKSREYHSLHKRPIRISKRIYARSERGKKLISEGNKRYNANRPERRIARRRINNGIRDGKIVKQPCLLCGAPKTEAHHIDYSRPLEVLWLCPEHHRAVHKTAA